MIVSLDGTAPDFRGCLGPRLLVTFALGVMVIAFGLWINPPSKVREDFQRAHPELFLKPANPPAIQR
jgi:hypothetical protein